MIVLWVLERSWPEVLKEFEVTRMEPPPSAPLRAGRDFRESPSNLTLCCPLFMLAFYTPSTPPFNQKTASNGLEFFPRISAKRDGFPRAPPVANRWKSHHVTGLLGIASRLAPECHLKTRNTSFRPVYQRLSPDFLTADISTLFAATRL